MRATIYNEYKDTRSIVEEWTAGLYIRMGWLKCILLVPKHHHILLNANITDQDKFQDLNM